ncbi:hypothetical protein [Methanobrevibacter filiformis]|uniref:Uncharacterized protein n=1 Tax=Methanobrevibacter filiformis TaxID=55758 RepID=A0A166ESD9_9EURY|nr:hypothetical protein [Methanobrevibacter filiformis]KZX16956.1 hypothetical protein MBFIL_04410 [Methanobrevibacter filiformis]
METQKIKTTVNIEIGILNELKAISNRKKTTQTEMINKLLKKGLLLEKQAEKQKETKGNNFLKLAGIVTAPKPFSATDEVRKLRNGEL